MYNIETGLSNFFRKDFFTISGSTAYLSAIGWDRKGKTLNFCLDPTHIRLYSSAVIGYPKSALFGGLEKQLLKIIGWCKIF